jgi:hypothetical protein
MSAHSRKRAIVVERVRAARGQCDEFVKGDGSARHRNGRCFVPVRDLCGAQHAGFGSEGYGSARSW